MNNTYKVYIIYQTDPSGIIPGGIDTFIRGIIRWAPDDIEINVVGGTTDMKKRPLFKWTTCNLGKKSCNFYPVYSMENPQKQSKIPLSLRLGFGTLLFKPIKKADVIEFHRVDSSIFFFANSTPKNVFIHQNMDVLKNPNADIRWKYLPSLFYKLEDFLIPRFTSIFAVRENAITNYKKKFPEIENRFRFIPTWMDPEIFFPLTKKDKGLKKKKKFKEYNFLENDLILVTAGRLDTQKDPLLLLESFNKVYSEYSNVRLIYIGDGILRSNLKKRINELGLQKQVVLAGLKSPDKVANILQVSDLFVLSSAYEGMPMCVLEALGCGIPVATTLVGEVERVVKPGVNGEISKSRRASDLAFSISKCINNIKNYSGEPCFNIVKHYTPEKILAQVYENYRKIASKKNHTFRNE